MKFRLEEGNVYEVTVNNKKYEILLTTITENAIAYSYEDGKSVISLHLFPLLFGNIKNRRKDGKIKM